MSNIFGIPSTCTRRTLHFDFGVKNRVCNECRSMAGYAVRIAIRVYAAVVFACVFETKLSTDYAFPRAFRRTGAKSFARSDEKRKRSTKVISTSAAIALFLFPSRLSDESDTVNTFPASRRAVAESAYSRSNSHGRANDLTAFH